MGRVDETMRGARARGSQLGRSAASKGRSAASRGSEISRNMRRLDVPWARCGWARMLREAILQFGLAPLMDLYTRRRVRGRELFRRLPPPVVFVANHSSHLDTPTILRALPLKWRQRTAVAAAADYFYKSRAVAQAVALIFNTVPLQRRGGGLGDGSMTHVDRLIDQRWNLLMFPEGTRSRDGRLGKMRSGAAVIAQQHNVPIVPIFVKGTHEAMPPGRNWPKRLKRRFLSRRHRVEVHFGTPIWPGSDEPRAEVMARVQAFLEAEAGGRFSSNGSSKAPVERPLTPAA
jgi:1-acyl-sn-glycerol-3-phosphate acyltransferase